MHLATECPKCGHVDNEGSAFCENCGQALPVQRITPTDDKNLQQVLEEEPLQRIELNRCIDWFDESLDLLVTLHSQNPPLIHGDIRPQFIKLNKNGRLYFSGFVGNTDETERKPDMATDIFCLGATFHFLFSGQLPHQPGSRELFLPLSKPLNTYVPDFPYEIQEILDRMLHPNRDLRYKTCQEIKDDLGQYIEKHHNRQRHPGGSRKISFSDTLENAKLGRISTVMPLSGGASSEDGASQPFSTFSPTERLKPVLPEPEPVEPEIAEVKEVMGFPRRFRLIAGILTVLVILAFVLPQMMPRWKFNQLLTKGDKSLDMKMYDKAMQDYKEALKIFPNRQTEVIERICRIHWVQAVECIRRDLFEESLNHIIRIRKLTSGEPQVREIFSVSAKELGREFLDMGKYYNAFFMAQGARMLNSTNLDTIQFHNRVKEEILERGIARYNREEYQGAVEDFDVLLNDPHQEGYLKVFYWRGSALVKLNRFLDGLDDLHKAKMLTAEKKIDLNPKEEEALEKFISYSNSQLQNIHLAKAGAELVEKGLNAHKELKYQEAVNFLGKFMRLIERHPQVKHKMGAQYTDSINRVKTSLAESYLKLAFDKASEKDLSDEAIETVREMCSFARKYDPSDTTENQCREIQALISRNEKADTLSTEAQKLLEMGQGHYDRGEYEKCINPLERFITMIETHREKEAIKLKLGEEVISGIPAVRKKLADAYYRRASGHLSKAGIDREAENRLNEDCRLSEKYDPSDENIRRCRELKKKVVLPRVNPDT